MNKKLQIKRKINNFVKRGLIILFFSLWCTQVSANLMMQKKVTVKLENSKIETVLIEIQKQTGLSFVYKKDELRSIPQKNINIKNSTVEEVLAELLKDTNLEYKIIGKNISISQKTNLPAQKIEQKIKIKGKVLDPDNKPIIGATLIIEGTTDGAISDDNGEFFLHMQPSKSVEISFIGMITQKRTFTKADNNVIIIMKENTLAVEDVVVTGIFNRRAGSFTGSATTIKSEDLQKVGSQNVFQALRNVDPSLMIFDNMEFGSDPNKNPKMALRGVSSFELQGDNTFDVKGTYGNDPNAPLFILDGFEASIQKVSDLDMNRIASVTILKDASAKALYGSKAANGVIVIETIRSKSSELRIMYRGSVDIQAPDLSSYNLTNAREKLELEVDAGKYFDKNLSTLYNLQRDYNQVLSAVLSGVDTDWIAKPLRNGVGTKHSLTFDVGTDKLSLLASFSYNNIKGTMKGSDRTNYEGSISLSYRYKTLNIRNNLTVNSNIANDSPYGNFSEYARINPYLSPIDEAGNIVQNANILAGDGNFVANPIYNATLNTRLSNEYIDVTNNVNIEWTIIPGLMAMGRFGISEKRNKADEFYPANHLKFRSLKGDEYFRKGTYKINEGDDKKLSGDFNIQYSKIFADKHYISAGAGYSLAENSYEEIAYSAEGFPNDKMNDMIFARSYTKDSKPTGRESTIRDIGVHGIANYAYDDRYLIDGTFKTNASSQFGKNTRWGKFWSAGLGWNVHGEKWFDCDDISKLKLRGSTGYTGSQSSSAYAALATYQYILDQTYQGFLGSYLKGMRNDDLKWEDKQEYNIGLDFEYKRILSLTVEYYVAKTKNNVLAMDIPSYSGFSSITENVGEVENKGFDIKLAVTPWRMSSKRAYFTISSNLSANTNKVAGISESLKSYNDKQNAAASDVFNNKPVTKYQDGVSMMAIWAVRSLGIDPTDGTEIYLDQNGNITKVYSASNLVVCGDNLPKLQGNVGFNFGYKGFEISAVCRFMYGGQMYNTTLVDKVENADVENSNVDRRVYDGRWRKPGDVKPYKTLGNKWIQEAGEVGDYIDMATQLTSRFVMDRNEFGLGALSLGYDFYDHKFIKKLGMQRLKVSFNMNDVFLLSSIKIERGTGYPFARSFNFALQATF